MDAGRVSGRLVEELQCAGEGEVRVGKAQGRGGDLRECGLHEDGRGLGGAGERSVSGIGDKGDVAGGCLFDAGDSGDYGGGVAVELSAEAGGEVGEGEAG